jgi:hypothetical protein
MYIVSLTEVFCVGRMFFLSKAEIFRDVIILNYSELVLKKTLDLDRCSA